MSTGGRCAQCGGPLMVEGLCAACLLGDGVHEQTAGLEGAPYRLVNLLGENDRATAYLAALDGQTPTQVVVKVLRSDLDGRELGERIDVLKTKLAALDHPNIVGLLDGGWPGRGRAYVVSEYIKGLPLIPSCRRAAASASERLRLLAQVCLAVAYAHERGVTHGGITSANVLVVTQAGDPAVRVVDFGLARLVAAPTPPPDLAADVIEDLRQLVALLGDLLSPIESENLNRHDAVKRLLDDARGSTAPSRWTSAAQLAADLRKNV